MITVPSCVLSRLFQQASIATLSATFVVGYASAENTQRKVSSIIEEVVVTAQKREQSANDVPVAINAFTGDSLKALGVVDTRDLSKVVPGFSASENGYNTPVYTLRGVGFNDTTYTATSTVGVYVDEVSLPYSIMTKGANLDVQRVEVLKGPQGTLFGRNTTGGAINYVAEKPSEELSGYISAQYGRFESTEVEASISGPFSDTLRGRLAVKDIRSSEGWQQSITRDDSLGRTNKQAFRGILEWDANDDLTATLTLSGWRDRSEAQAPQPVAIRSGNPFVGDAALAPVVANHPTTPNEDDNRAADWSDDFDWELRDSFYNGALRFDWYFDDQFHLVSLSSYGKVESDGSEIPGSGLSVLNSEQTIFASVETYSQEVRLHSESAALNWVVGANYNFDDGTENHITYVDTISLLFPDPVTNQATVSNRAGARGDTQAEAVSAFFSVDWQLADSWLATVGARYTDETRDYEGCSYEPEGASGTGTSSLFTILSAQRALTSGSMPHTIEEGECFTLDENGDPAIFSDTLNENNVSARVVLSWTPDDSKLFYASVVQGYKSGGYPVLNGSDQKQLTPVTQEKLVSYELGSKTSFFDDSVQLNLAAFYYDYTDKQLLTRIDDFTFGPLPILQNAPKSKIEGAELDLQWRSDFGVFASLAASYIDSTIKEFESFNINGEPEDFKDRPFNFAPVWQASIVVDYSFPLGNNWDGGVALDYSYSSETNSTIEGDENYKQDAYQVFGARIRMVSIDGSWSITASGRNLTNEFVSGGVFQIGDSVARYAGRPTDYSLAVRYQF